MAKNKGEHRGAALITGASSGIGKEFAHVLAAHGHDVVLVARDARRLGELANELQPSFGIKATLIPKDLSEPGAAQEIYSEVQTLGIRVDILVNNAGFNVYGPFVETALDGEARMIQVNLVTLTVLTKLFARDMAGWGHGRILNVASTASFSPAPFVSVYGATKAFVLSFSEVIAEELRGTGVTVTALCPGPTESEFAERAAMLDTKIFRGRLMSARQVATIGYKALMRGRTTVVTGLANQVLVWSMRLSPRAMVARIAKGLMSKQVPALTAGARHS